MYFYIKQYKYISLFIRFLGKVARFNSKLFPKHWCSLRVKISINLYIIQMPNKK